MVLHNDMSVLVRSARAKNELLMKTFERYRQKAAIVESVGICNFIDPVITR